MSNDEERINRFKDGLRKMEGQPLSGIAFLSPGQYEAFQSSGRLALDFSMDQEGNPVRLPSYSMETKQAQGGGAFGSKKISDADLFYLYQRVEIIRKAVERPAKDAFR